MRECFEEVEEFAFGGGGGLTDKDVCALDTMAICGDRVGVVLAFLRRAKFDVREAKESIRRCCAWRRKTECELTAYLLNHPPCGRIMKR